MQILFPYNEIRKEQDKLLKDALYTIENKKALLAHAPTGLGKTAAVLSPAISYALENQKKVFFLTPKISQHEVAVTFVNNINSKFSTKIQGVDLVGKQHMCPNPLLKNADSSTFYELCKRLKKKESCSFYANASGFNPEQRMMAKYYIKKVKNNCKRMLHHIELKDFCESFECPYGKGLCTYEVALQFANEANIIVADYFHIFSPKIRQVLLQRAGYNLEDCILIIDEAHNLPERLRKLMSSSISTKLIDSALEEASKIKADSTELISIKNVLKLMAKKILNNTKKPRIANKASETLICKEELEANCKDVDFSGLSAFLSDLSLEYIEAFPYGRSALQKLASFFEKWAVQDSSFIRILKSEKDNVFLKLKAMDPSLASKNVFEKAHSAVLMSGTLLPQKMYADLLGVPEERTIFREYASPFPEKNKLTLFVPNSTTKYSERNFEEYRKIAQVISRCANSVPGNVAVFFPSFSVMNSVCSVMNGELNKKLLTQKENMSAKERYVLLNEFKKSAENGAILFAVASGSFAEGIDYVGNQLLGAIIVGIPLNDMDLEQKCLIEYCQQKFGFGWHYAYINPAITRAIQASGRVIRDRNDRGIVVFLDKRYLWKNYSKCFPRETKKIVTSEPEKFIVEFWKQNY
ncbi:MAG: ATP-dependent DNA helicase [Candidatus Diapherotrites archaeon]|nr:ATP-dependent DNA helicase [Candidatus Diapherotrites archaeon]